MRDIPGVAYTSANMFTVLTTGSGNTPSHNYNLWSTASLIYQGPIDAIKMLAIALSSQGAVLPVIPPAPDSTWNVTFFGPSMRCKNVSGSLRNAISLDIARSMNLSMFCESDYTWATACAELSDPPVNPLYFAWTPSVPSNISPDDSSFEGYVWPLHRQNSKMYDISDRSTGDMAPLYVAVIPSVIELYHGKNYWDWPMNATLHQVVEKYIDPGLTLLQCDLHNATYDVRYNFSAGLQTVESTVSLLSSDPVQVISMAWGFTPEQDYEGLYAFPKIGQELPAPADCRGLWRSSTPSAGTNTTCAFDASILANFSFQAAWDSITSLVRGGMYERGSFGLTGTSNSSIVNTILARSTELRPIIRMLNATQSNQPNWDRYMPGIYLVPDEVSTPSLSSLLEELFQNFTLSLATLPELQ